MSAKKRTTFVLPGEPPSEPQMRFFRSTVKHTAYGGARGGGKSWAMRRKLVLLCLTYDNLKCLLLRRTLPELQENHVIPLQQELAGIATYNGSQRVFTFPNGSRLKLGYCDREADVYQYQGQEYDVVALEEATHFTESQMQFLTTCNRNVRTDFSPRMYYTCNPGGVGHHWVKRLFIDREYRDTEHPEDYAFVPARVFDNKVLMERDPQYLRSLEALAPHLRKAFLDGDWDAVEGQYFDDFDKAKHVCAPFDIPASWRRFRAMDWGYNDPCCVLWFAVAPNGQVYVYDELYVRKTLASGVAQLIVSKSRGQRVQYTVASPDAWHTHGGESIQGMSIAEVFTKNSVPLMPADNNRVLGWQRVHEYLAPLDEESKLMRLQIFTSCKNLIRTLPVLTASPTNCEDVDAHCEDHAPEALRYGLMSRPAPKRAMNINSGKARRAALDPLTQTKPRKKAASNWFGV